MLNVFKDFRTCGNNSAGSSGALGSEAGNNFSEIVFQIQVSNSMTRKLISLTYFTFGYIFKIFS